MVYGGNVTKLTYMKPGSCITAAWVVITKGPKTGIRHLNDGDG